MTALMKEGGGGFSGSGSLAVGIMEVSREDVMLGLLKSGDELL